MRQVTVNIPDSFYKSFIEFFKHIPEVTIQENTAGEDVPVWHKKTLDERLADHKKNPKKGTDWDDFEKELDKV